jgi:hypothetical protein
VGAIFIAPLITKERINKMTMDVRTTKNPVEQPIRVWYAEDTAVEQGIGMVFDYTFADANVDGLKLTDPCGKRANSVKNVGAANASTDFAGVTVAPVAAKVGGQWIYLYAPGSVCMVKVNTDVTNAARLALSKNAATKGVFVAASATPEQGNGAAVVLQTRTGAGLALAKLFAGSECGLKA